jgi:hypothetical protein
LTHRKTGKRGIQQDHIRKWEGVPVIMYPIGNSQLFLGIMVGGFAQFLSNDKGLRGAGGQLGSHDAEFSAG